MSTVLKIENEFFLCRNQASWCRVTRMFYQSYQAYYINVRVSCHLITLLKTYSTDKYFV